MHSDKCPGISDYRTCISLCCFSSVKFNYRHIEYDRGIQLSKQLSSVAGQVYLTARANKEFQNGPLTMKSPTTDTQKPYVNRPSENSHRVARGCASIEVFEELRRASILAGDLLPDLCRHSPVDRGETREGERVSNNGKSEECTATAMFRLDGNGKKKDVIWWKTTTLKLNNEIHITCVDSSSACETSVSLLPNSLYHF